MFASFCTKMHMSADARFAPACQSARTLSVLDAAVCAVSFFFAGIVSAFDLRIILPGGQNRGT